MTRPATPIPAPEPDVLFVDDLCRRLRMSKRSLYRARRLNAFPIPELPTLDGRPRWSRIAVERYLEGQPLLLRRRA